MFLCVFTYMTTACRTLSITTEPFVHVNNMTTMCTSLAPRVNSSNDLENNNQRKVKILI